MIEFKDYLSAAGHTGFVTGRGFRKHVDAHPENFPPLTTPNQQLSRARRDMQCVGYPAESRAGEDFIRMWLSGYHYTKPVIPGTIELGEARNAAENCVYCNTPTEGRLWGYDADIPCCFDCL